LQTSVTGRFHHGTDGHHPQRRNADGEETVKKVPVMDDLELVGIVTMTDIVWHFAELRKEASEMGEAYSRWKPR
jgi:CBS domain-containing protein